MQSTTDGQTTDDTNTDLILHTDRFYKGRIVDVRKNNGGTYGFIAMKSVLRRHGQPNDLISEEDIYLHESDCPNDPLETDIVVEFTVVLDETRDGWALRAKNARRIKRVRNAILKITGEPDSDLVMTRSVYHAKAKQVDERLVRQVIENRPFEGITPDEEPSDDDILSVGDEGAFEQAMLQYLEQQYAGLVGIDIEMKILDFDEEKARLVLQEEIAENKALGMVEQVRVLQEEFDSLVPMIGFFKWILKDGLLSADSKIEKSMIKTLFQTVEEEAQGPKRAEKLRGMMTGVNFIASHGVLRRNSLLPKRTLADLMAAVPVIYIVAENGQLQLVDHLSAEDDPRVHPFVAYLCSRFPTEHWADFVQIYNRRIRSISQYKGEIIPKKTRKLIKESKGHFTWVGVFSCYHDVAGRDWSNLNWMRSLDPYVLGFNKDLDVVFNLDRYSGDGIFPLHADLVADTVDFLRRNRSKLAGFGSADQPYWYRHGDPDGHLQTRSHGAVFVRRLQRMVDGFSLAFDAGHLFEWLRGEWQLPEEVLKKQTEEEAQAQKVEEQAGRYIA